MNKYPFLRQAANGCVSGQIIDWPQFKPEAAEAMSEIDSLRASLETCKLQRDEAQDMILHYQRASEKALQRVESLQRSLDEALNSGDGSY